MSDDRDEMHVTILARLDEVRDDPRLMRRWRAATMLPGRTLAEWDAMCGGPGTAEHAIYRFMQGPAKPFYDGP